MTELRATYRLQLSAQFGFAEAAAAVPYLQRLGVSHLYLSPALASTPGSEHGYDVCDVHRIDDDLGGEGGFRALVDRAHEHGLGIVIDIVPNHMATHHSNQHWFDVLRFGPRCRHATWFDIEWSHGNDTTADRVLLPVLADHYGAVLTTGDLRVERWCHDIVVRYFDRIFPLSIGSLARVVASATRAADHPTPQVDRFVSALFALGDSPAEQVEGGRLLALVADAWSRDPVLAAALDEELARISDDRDELHQLLEEQHYRLARWTAASEDLDYRRFFDVADLIGVRMEDPAVFESTHSRIAELVASGAADGIRVDHPDGLADPADYVERLRAIAPHAWIVVEKILVGDEELPAGWPVDGTTGYETAAAIDRLWVDPDAVDAMTDAMAAYTGERDSWDTVRRASEQLVADQILVGEVRRLAADLTTIVADSPDRLDVSRASVEAVVAAFAVETPVYRTYVQPGRPADDRDALVIARTADAVRANHPHIEAELIDAVADLLRGPTTEERSERFVRRFQQLSGPVMAKGVEDTAAYRYPRLVSLNEVGSDPDAFGISLEEFHRRQRLAAERWPRRMVTTSTHDTKRSADVRSRIAALSEIPGQWRAVLHRIGERLDELTDGRRRDPVIDQLLVQTIVGAGPIGTERAGAYARKAAREAKRTTSWLDPDVTAEAELEQVVGHLMTDPVCRGLFDTLRDGTARSAEANILGTTLLGLTLPGIPDLYQGSELPTFDLVDPDNRRPVDLAERERLLDDPTAQPPKLQLTLACLGLRRDRPACFVGASASYEPLWASGPAAHHVVAFRRGDDAVAVAARLLVRLERDGGWRDTELVLPDGDWLDVVSGRHATGTTGVAELMGAGPVVLLSRR